MHLPHEPAHDPGLPPPLRESVVRAMGGAAPAEVRERVARLLSTDTGGLTPPAWSTGHDRPAATLLIGPRRANALAVAASLMLVAGAVLFGIFGPRIGTNVGRDDATTVAEVAAVVVSEHALCTRYDSCGLQSAPWRCPMEASVELSRLLRRDVRIPDLESAGFEFCCGGQTVIPGAGARSGHLLYCRMDGESCAWLSIFVAPVETRFLASDALGRTSPLDCGIHYYRFIAPGSGELFYFCDGVVTWFVKPSDPADFEIVRHFFPDSIG